MCLFPCVGLPDCLASCSVQHQGASSQSMCVCPTGQRLVSGACVACEGTLGREIIRFDQALQPCNEIHIVQRAFRAFTFCGLHILHSMMFNDAFFWKGIRELSGSIAMHSLHSRREICQGGRIVGYRPPLESLMVKDVKV